MKHIGREVVIKDNAISAEKCNRFIELFEDEQKLILHLDEEYEGNTRYKNLPIVTSSAPNIHKFITDQIKESIKEYKALLNIPFYLGEKFENPEIMKFCRNQDQFDTHYDGNGNDHGRTLALIWYLNDVEEGGELHLPSKSNYIKVSPKQGRLAIVPTDWTHYHYVVQPISCDRYSLITFIRY
jgi:hypothetical protein